MKLNKVLFILSRYLIVQSQQQALEKGVRYVQS